MARLVKAKDLKPGDVLPGGGRVKKVTRQGPNVIWVTDSGSAQRGQRRPENLGPMRRRLRRLISRLKRDPQLAPYSFDARVRDRLPLPRVSPLTFEEWWEEYGHGVPAHQRFEAYRVWYYEQLAKEEQ